MIDVAGWFWKKISYTNFIPTPVFGYCYLKRNVKKLLP